MSAAPAPRAAHSGQFDLRPILFVVGVLLTTLAVFMLPSMVADIVVGNRDWIVFLLAGSVTLFVGVSLILGNRNATLTTLGTRQAFILTTSVWLTLTVFASLPFLYADLEMRPVDAFFEAMSGITTTGATVMTSLDTAPPGILLWRSVLQWLGGIGIIVMGVAVLPVLSVGGMQLFRTESSDRSEKVFARAGQLASAIGMVYLTLTLLCGAAYWGGGMDLFDAANHAMTTVATAGFSTRDASIGAFDSAFVEWTAVVFMLAGAMPFVLYIRALAGEPRVFAFDNQVRWLLGIVLASWCVLATDLVVTDNVGVLDAVRLAALNSTSVITTTGFTSADYSLWGPMPLTLFFFLACVGGCTGSTTGGIKIFRFVVLYAIARTQVLRLVQPSGVILTTYQGRPVSDAAAISVMAFFFLFALSFSMLALALALTGLDYLTAMSGSISALANVGPGLGAQIGPVTNFDSLPDAAKWLLAIAMLLGRLELFTVLVLFTPAFWRR
ncbi:MAG: TrkH family potassium uptake protein [Alphaproteobacteria bacterium]